MSAGAALRSLPTYLLLGAMSFLSTFPFLWMLIGATNASADIARGKVSPGTALAENVGQFFAAVDAPLIFWNSAKIALGASALTLLVSSMAGYGFEVFRSPARERVYGAILSTLFVPFAALLIPLFIMMGSFGLINTHVAVVLPTIASTFVIFFFRQSSKAFPLELRDAARMDGLAEWQIFLLIYVPVMRSTFAAAFIIAFMASWNAYLWPLVVLQSNEMKTITLTISSLASAYYPDYGVVMVGAVMATLPTLAVFFAMQRQFVQGLVGSAK